MTGSSIQKQRKTKMQTKHQIKIYVPNNLDDNQENRSPPKLKINTEPNLFTSFL